MNRKLRRRAGSGLRTGGDHAAQTPARNPDPNLALSPMGSWSQCADLGSRRLPLNPCRRFTTAAGCGPHFEAAARVQPELRRWPQKTQEDAKGTSLSITVLGTFSHSTWSPARASLCVSLRSLRSLRLIYFGIRVKPERRSGKTLGTRETRTERGVHAAAGWVGKVRLEGS